jgi:hypothetical protein
MLCHGCVLFVRLYIADVVQKNTGWLILVVCENSMIIKKYVISNPIICNNDGMHDMIIIHNSVMENVHTLNCTVIKTTE